MNRLLHKTLLKHLPLPPFLDRSKPPKKQRGSGLNHQLLKSVLMMATVGGFLCPERALSASLVWGNAVWPPLTFSNTYTVPTANGGSVNVRLTWSGDLGTITRLDNDFASSIVTGGEPNPGPNNNSLLSIFNPDTIDDEITVTIEFIDNAGNPIPSENVNFTIFDIDRDNIDGDNTSNWQDVVTINGSFGGNAVLPNLSTPPGSNTVSISGNVATGIFPPPPAPPNQEAGNTTGEGNLEIAYPSVVDTLTYTYGNGPESPDNPDEHGIALFNVNFNPAIIGLAKSAGTPVPNPDGSFTVPYTLTVENLGETQLNNVQITEDLTTTFANANGFTVSNIQSANLTENINFNGVSITNLLQGVDTLAPGAIQTVTFDVVIIPGAPTAGGLGPFNNTAVVTAATPSGAPVDDLSTDAPNVGPGAPGDPDPDGNGDPGDNNTPTVVNLPGIGVAKQVADVVDNGNNNFVVTYELVVTNLGPVPLENVQVTEDLSQTFADAASFNVTDVATGGAPLTANFSFNGSTDQNLLAGTDTLASGASQTISFVVNVNTGGNRGPYDNTALASGSNSGVTVTDQSDDGVNPDPNPNDGNPGGGPGENDPTQILLPDTEPIIGVAKRVSDVVDNGNNNFTVTYELVVENLGPVPLENVQVTEDLNPTFEGATSFNVTNVATGGAPLTPNAGFDGSTDLNLLVGTDTLAVGASQTISFVVNIDTGDNQDPYINTAVASGSSGGVTVTDNSDDGVDPDPNPNDGNPGGGPEENDPTRISLPPEASIQLIKRITTIIQGDNPPTEFSELVENPPHPSFVGVRELTEPTLSTGDVVEYTIYFLNNGFVEASSVEICDPIPPPTEFVTDGFSPGQGIQFDPPGAPTVITLTNANDGDAGRFISPLTPLSACPDDSAGDQGAVVVNVGNVSPDEFGFVRFRTSIP